MEAYKMNYIFISPNFPTIYSHFVRELNKRGVNVLGIGDQPYSALNDELKANLKEYCYVSDMNNIAWMINTIQYLKDKYGSIDFIESNNEYWMKNDALYREWFNVKGGYRPAELEVLQTKSGMKKYFQEAGLKTARYILVSTFEESRKFIRKVGYPVFAKPDNGVGAAHTYKISNLEDLKRFHEEKPNEVYIMEEFINGHIVTFDGIANKECEVTICFNETFPDPIAELVAKNLDCYYYAKSSMSKEFRKMGERIVKSFGISQRCFHIELWKLDEDKKGLAEKGEIIALEANLRSPGGITPDLLNLVSKADYYSSYAEMIVNNAAGIDNSTDLVSYSINRKYCFEYVHSAEEIRNKYNEEFINQGTYPLEFRDAMGDEWFLFRFKHDARKEREFLDYVLPRK